MFFNLSRLGIIAKTLPWKRSIPSVALLRVLIGFHKPSSAFWSGPRWQKLGVTAIILAECKAILETYILDCGLISAMLWAAKRVDVELNKGFRMRRLVGEPDLVSKLLWNLTVIALCNLVLHLAHLKGGTVALFHMSIRSYSRELDRLPHTRYTSFYFKKLKT